MISDPGHLSRFLEAQVGSYERARSELAAGRKRTHWMWFIFPQIRGLGSSPTARQYAIASIAEAQAYLAHPILGTRLRELTAILLELPDPDPDSIFAYPDNLKLHSSLTLFAEASRARKPSDPGDAIFQRALDRLFAGRSDHATLQQLET